MATALHPAVYAIGNYARNLGSCTWYAVIDFFLKFQTVRLWPVRCVGGYIRLPVPVSSAGGRSIARRRRRRWWYRGHCRSVAIGRSRAATTRDSRMIVTRLSRSKDSRAPPPPVSRQRRAAPDCFAVAGFVVNIISRYDDSAAVLALYRPVVAAGRLDTYCI